MAGRRRILVICTGNRARSQMAEGWLRHFGGDGVEVCSAGTQPKGVHPLAIEVMAEAGVDITGHTSDHVSKYQHDTFDFVVTVCDSAKEACPVFPGAGSVVHRGFEDPDKPGLAPAEAKAVFERIRDEIRDWARDFVRAE
jgi:arsenate reductase